MRCPFCGKETRAPFCPGCGASLQKYAQAPGSDASAAAQDREPAPGPLAVVREQFSSSLFKYMLYAAAASMLLQLVLSVFGRGSIHFNFNGKEVAFGSAILTMLLYGLYLSLLHRTYVSAAAPEMPVYTGWLTLMKVLLIVGMAGALAILYVGAIGLFSVIQYGTERFEQELLEQTGVSLPALLELEGRIDTRGLMIVFLSVVCALMVFCLVAAFSLVRTVNVTKRAIQDDDYAHISLLSIISLFVFAALGGIFGLRALFGGDFLAALGQLIGCVMPVCTGLILLRIRRGMERCIRPEL